MDLLCYTHDRVPKDYNNAIFACWLSIYKMHTCSVELEFQSLVQILRAGTITMNRQIYTLESLFAIRPSSIETLACNIYLVNYAISVNICTAKRYQGANAMRRGYEVDMILVILIFMFFFFFFFFFFNTINEYACPFLARNDDFKGEVRAIFKLIYR